MGTPSIHVIRKIEEISSPGACRWDHRRASWGEGSVAGRSGVWRHGTQHAGPHRRIAHFADTNACGTWDWEHRAPAACAAGRNATRVLWKRRDSFTGKRYDHGTLGDGRSVAGPGVSRLQAGISAGSDGAV